jgi:hypothetical protein
MVEKHGRLQLDQVKVDIISGGTDGHHMPLMHHIEKPSIIPGVLLPRKHRLSLVVRRRCKDHPQKTLGCER